MLIYDPLTTQPDGSRTPSAGNQDPRESNQSVAAAMLKYYPAPTSMALGRHTSRTTLIPSRWIGDLNQWIGRLDYNINSKNIVFFPLWPKPLQRIPWTGLHHGSLPVKSRRTHRQRASRQKRPELDIRTGPRP